jgi:hypothetical protein
MHLRSTSYVRGVDCRSSAIAAESALWRAAHAMVRPRGLTDSKAGRPTRGRAWSRPADGCAELTGG